jgi:hypothetical protein
MPDVNLTEKLRELYNSIEETIGGSSGTVRVTWPVVLLLASKER